MCKWGTDVVMMLPVAAHLSRTGKRYMKRVGVDACIAPIVKALNDGGVETVASCCGHGRGPGSIVLADGRELVVAANRAEARAVEELLRLEAAARDVVNECRDDRPPSNGAIERLAAALPDADPNRKDETDARAGLASIAAAPDKEEGEDG